MSPLSPVNIVISEDPLLRQEAGDQIVSAAKESGVGQRDIVDIIDKFNWDELFANTEA